MLYRYTLAFIFVIGCSASYAVAKDVDGEPPLSPVMQCIADCYAASGSVAWMHAPTCAWPNKCSLSPPTMLAGSSASVVI